MLLHKRCWFHLPDPASDSVRQNIWTQVVSNSWFRSTSCQTRTACESKNTANNTRCTEKKRAKETSSRRTSRKMKNMQNKKHVQEETELSHWQGCTLAVLWEWWITIKWQECPRRAINSDDDDVLWSYRSCWISLESRIKKWLLHW